MLSGPVAEWAGQDLNADSSSSSLTSWNLSLMSNEGDLIWSGVLLWDIRSENPTTYRLPN